ncbi:MAG: Methylated-DNA--protein-cysteine methyltransferase (EC [uncultured Campylobacterales bacterium]|uniref:methylated-DNA--[protein]-cysteine S-methyltransferase n=1 Tax=uncultured Campylobacterales bacterium TaxID=352960 RepID=A0A6S6SWE4_9BACT|nr:MAG: Methylated-DNA--protein-cysteine methyltransferase (EC [uncultured Campylobacterales bacterium]
MNFNEQCYDLLIKIPEGKITTYKLMAEALNIPKAYRAVGNAMAKNKVPIIIPCHRVVKSDGGIGGFALGAARKIELLEEEGITIKNNIVINLRKYLWDFK